jgi:hypothetical protein
MALISASPIFCIELGFTQYKYVGLYTYFSGIPVKNSTEKI